MAKAVTVEIQGLERLQKNLNQLPKKLRKEIGAELGFATEQMADYARNDAPADQSFLRQEITVKKIDELDYEYISGADYSPYVEFGTRHKVQIPAGLSEVAAEFKGRKGASSLSVKELIFAWCKRKGIEEKAWYPIYVSLMVNGIAPHPFFFKQVERVRPQLIKNIDNILDSLTL
jgi:hypothetical protein